MGHFTNQQRIEQLEQKLEEWPQRVLAQIHSKMTRLEEKLTKNQEVLETKYTVLNKSMALLVENQLKMQETLNQLLNRNITPQNSHYPNSSQNTPRNFPHSTTLTINPLSIPSPVMVHHQHLSLIPTSYLNPPLITTKENQNQQPQNHHPQNSGSPSPIKTVTPPTNHPLTLVPNLNQKDLNIQCHNFSTPLNHISITQRRWRKIKRRWKIRKKIKKKKRRPTAVAAARVAEVGKFHLSEVTTFSLSSKHATMAKFLIIFFTSISISFCKIAAMDNSLSTSSPSPTSPPPSPFSASETVYSPHFIMPISSISQIPAELGFRDLSMATCTLSLSSESHLPGLDRPITIFAPSDTLLRTCPSCWLLVLLQEHSVSGLYHVDYSTKLIFGSKIETIFPGRCLVVTSTFIGTKIFINGAMEASAVAADEMDWRNIWAAGGRWKSANTIFFWILELEREKKKKEEAECLRERNEIVGFIFKSADDVISDVSTQMFCWNFDTDFVTPYNFTFDDITSHMAMLYDVGHTLKEILASSMTINSTMSRHQIMSPYLYLDADHYPP